MRTKKMLTVWFMSITIAVFLQTGRLSCQEDVANEDLIFSLGFGDSTFEADMAIGNPKLIASKGILNLVEGLHGKGLLIGSGGSQLTYDLKENFDIRQGTISCWVKPLKWSKNPEELPKLHLKFWMTSASEKGYLGIEKIGTASGATAPILLAWVSHFQCLQKIPGKGMGIQANTAKWNEGEWHHVVLNINRTDFELYLDGKTAGKISLPPGSISPEELLDRQFIVGTPDGEVSDQAVLDEIKIYKRPLTAEEVSKLGNVNIQ
ncbi:MAG: LamG-like jellyroll fold domain-containing protein [Candidatus Omnitrophota bacterium]